MMKEIKEFCYYCESGIIPESYADSYNKKYFICVRCAVQFKGDWEERKKNWALSNCYYEEGKCYSN